MKTTALATRQGHRLRPDPSRVIGQLFVAGHSLPVGTERASDLVEHILGLSENEVEAALDEVTDRFDDRHADLTGMFAQHADRISHRLPAGVQVSNARRLLLGATFTQEYAVEAAALCNPSMVAAPDQAGTDAGTVRVVMSVRQVGEGHRSTIGFREGWVARDGAVVLQDPSRRASVGKAEIELLRASTFADDPRLSSDDREATAWVMEGLGERFSMDEMEVRLSGLRAQRDSRRDVGRTIRRLRELASRSYGASFPATSDLSARVLHPAVSAEAHGMEDARFVRFVDDDSSVTYYASYTAYDGVGIALQLLQTTDFVTWSTAPLLGAAAANKGLALFPRRIGGRYAALSRNDGANNGVAFSDDVRRWDSAIPLDDRQETWQVVQVGNCGSPIEVDEGWLVLTHGVGPMRTYCIGALLLDLDDPTKVHRRLREPLLCPQADEQDGYVPNVVYSCGGFLHHRTLVVPYGIGDASIGIATVEVDELLAAMV